MRWNKKGFLTLLLCILVMSPATAVYAKGQTKPVDMDTFFEEKMEEYQIPGAAVVVVDHGEIIFQKEYGYSNLDNRKRFDKDTTFRIASITKTFTATALMQLVEEGKVNLTSDIREYLPTLVIDNPYDVPVTVENLLNYTSGIDSCIIKDLSHTPVDISCGFLLNEMNQKKIKVVTKPGTHIEYCSYGVVLEGCIIEAVSGESCADYINNHILQPLGMNHTKMSMSDEQLSSGYILANDKLQPYTMDGYFKIYPEGGLLSSTSDMARYLKLFTANENGIIQNKTIQSMLTQSITYDALLPGMCYGFSEYDEGGVRVVGHGGYAPDGFLSQLDLYPEQGMGTFVVVNQGRNNDVPSEFREFFIDCLQLTGKNPPVFTEVVSENTLKIEGSYRFSDYSKTTLCKGDAFGGKGEVSVKKAADGIITLKGVDEFTGQKYEYRAKKIDDSHYYIEENEKYVVFLVEQNKVTGMAMTDDSWHGYYEKIDWYETAGFQVPFLAAALILYIGCMITVLFGAVIRLLRRKTGLVSPLDIKRHFLQGSIAFLNAGFLIYSLYNWGDRLRYSIPFDVKLNLCMPVAGTIGMFLYLLLTIKEIRHKEGKAVKRVFDLCYLVISTCYILLLVYWKLYGFNY